MTGEKPRIAITMGDPAGVGPELCLRALADPELRGFGDLVVHGDGAVLAAAAERMGIAAPDAERVCECGGIGLEDFAPGTASGATGRAGYAYVRCAIEAANAGEVDGVVTAPLNKEALHAAGIDFPGHTEIFAAAWGVDRFCMLQHSDVLSCTFVTVHVGYAEVPGRISAGRIGEVVGLSRDAFLRLRGREPKLVVLGLNPHAGERGLFGDGEEERLIAPAVEAAVARGWDVEGPIPPDTAFLERRRQETDCFVCMYHDQGHIPVKALAFDRAVNTTLGLPVPRTSVDHGTALDIAWRGVADPSSLFEAVKLNARLAAG